MKKNIAKNERGYIISQTRLEILKTVLLFTASAGVLLIGMGTTGNKYNLLTVIAVLGMLPASKFLINCIMFARARKAVPPRELYSHVDEAVADAAGPPLLKYEFYMTAYDNSFPIYVMACKDKCLIGYSGREDFKTEKCEEHIKAMAKQNGLEASAVKIFLKEEKFLERLAGMCKTDTEATEKDRALLHLMENLSL